MFRMKHIPRGNLCSIEKLAILALGIPFAFLFSDVINPDRPLRGKWDLNLQIVWEIDRVGSDVFLQPDRLQATDLNGKKLGKFSLQWKSRKVSPGFSRKERIAT
jgi:hypothetical protein